MNDLSLNEVCRILGKSKRTIGRYIDKGLLNPDKFGTEYRFNRSEVESLLKAKLTKKNKPVSRNLSMTAFLREQIRIKDELIAELVERQRETNILLRGYQEQTKQIEHKKDDETKTTPDKKTGFIVKFYDWLFKRGG
jgi:excisionase family DNA binding protein